MTTLEILAPYLPYGIEVQSADVPNGHAALIGLAPPFGLEGRELARLAVLRPASLCEWHPVAGLQPILKGFADLCTPLADGTVPAHRLLELLEIPLRDGEAAHLNDSTLWVTAPRQVRGVWALHHFTAVDIPLNVATYLRSKHFAVGLRADQYIRKDA